MPVVGPLWCDRGASMLRKSRFTQDRRGYCCRTCLRRFQPCSSLCFSLIGLGVRAEAVEASLPASRRPAKVEALGALLQATYHRPSRASTLAVPIRADVLARLGLLEKVVGEGAVRSPPSSFSFAGLSFSFATFLWPLALGPGVGRLVVATRRRMASLLPLCCRHLGVSRAVLASGARQQRKWH